MDSPHSPDAAGLLVRGRGLRQCSVDVGGDVACATDSTAAVVVAIYAVVEVHEVAHAGFGHVRGLGVRMWGDERSRCGGGVGGRGGGWGSCIS